MSRLSDLREKVGSGFFSFWVINSRISFLFVFAIIIMGILSLFSIPKESSPSIKFGMIMISTVYPGTNPSDIDSLISDKLYKEIKDIKGIDTITSNSSLGFSSIVITLKTGVDSDGVVNEVRNNINRVVLPTDAKVPVVTEVDTDTKQAFSIYVYDKTKSGSHEGLIDKAHILKEKLESLPNIDSVVFGAGAMNPAQGGSSANGADKYDIEFIISPDSLKSSGLTIDTISSSVKAWNKDIPIGNFKLGSKNYDFRIDGKYEDAIKMLDIPIQLSNGNFIKLGDIVRVERVYTDKSIKVLHTGGEKFPYVSLVVNKVEGSSIFSVSSNAKQLVSATFGEENFKDYSYLYGEDLADNIIDDYKQLSKEALTTLLLVFFIMFLFVGFRDSLFATLTLPLAFLSTFIILYSLGYTLNFLTNFSLILSFGIAVDTIIVIVQGASAKIRVGYEPKTAIMLSLKEYAVPVISGVMTTIVVFIPMMFLPGIMGKFLAYIPITIFGVLATGLLLVLTVNSAIYLLFVKKKKTYICDQSAIEYASEEEKELLSLEREGKKELSAQSASFRVRFILFIIDSYKKILSVYLMNTFLRRLFIFLPIGFLLFSFVVIAPRVGFELFPGTDNNYMNISIEGANGLTTENMYKSIEGLEKYFSKYPEIEYTSASISDNKASMAVQLSKLEERKEKGQRSVYEIELLLTKDLEIYQQKGMKVTFDVLKGGPPGSKAIGLKLNADKSEHLPELISTAKEFEKYLKTVQGTKNVGLSSKDTPGQFVFTLKKDVLGIYSIPPAVLYGYIIQMMNGATLGSIEDNGTDMDIVLKQENFRDEASIDDILNASFQFAGKTYQVGNFVEYNITNSIASVTREDGNITISVEADLEKGMDTLTIQSQYEDFAKSYSFPSGISYSKGGENEENSELIVAVFTSFFIAIVAIFAILTLQFNSYSQPLIILYSVIMSLPIVMIGLIITGNKFSLPFGIGFISFTGIAVNHGIILIDAININLRKGMNSFTALVEAGSSRLEPMTLTTLTTVFGILPIAMSDEFWSGMGFTIIFGIITTTFLTLFIVKGLFYEVYLRSKNKDESL